MRQVVVAIAALVAGASLTVMPALAADKSELVEPQLGDDGMYHQDWFLNSFLDLREDLADSQADGKRMAIFFEQKGCPYCRDLHTKNLADPEINTWIRERFNVLQLNLWGDRDVTDFDGEVLAEKDLAQKYNVTFTPTIIFLPEDPAMIEGKSGPAVEAARMPGYFRPFHFISMFEWVWDKRGEKGQGFQRYILEKAEAGGGLPAE